MIDSHCHLDLPQFESDWQEVIHQAALAGVSRILIPGTGVSGWQRQIRMALDCERLDIAFGLHPYFFPPDPQQALAALATQISVSPVRAVAIGEIGIDGTVTTPVAEQQDLFEAQLALATTWQLPVIIHHRQSHHFILQSIKRCHFKQGGVVHAFSGSREVARQYVAAGFKLGIGGTITYTRANKTREAVAEMAMEHLLLETDAPDMPISGRQGQRNSPAYLGEVAEALAHIKHQPLSAVIAQTTANYFDVFGDVSQCR
ncbi:TatD family hydrolase [Alteromonas lipolytica]|uniref:Hydrolase TatD n=1 Tax=Alteromonas lipolytica TaxID=1856405 RepID=A0A1E8F9D1_9ALTE|nr:TatD family hydrolase [Alteromonas lipolytica]OFI32510.1 hypothetical protein BFC17_04915 [Alteromonas lipolytica]GGF75605.1 deoxyribonuclease [Alteromonas lipolytica]